MWESLTGFLSFAGCEIVPELIGLGNEGLIKQVLLGVLAWEYQFVATSALLLEFDSLFHPLATNPVAIFRIYLRGLPGQNAFFHFFLLEELAFGTPVMVDVEHIEGVT